MAFTKGSCRHMQSTACPSRDYQIRVATASAGLLVARTSQTARLTSPVVCGSDGRTPHRGRTSDGWAAPPGEPTGTGHSRQGLQGAGDCGLDPLAPPPLPAAYSKSPQATSVPFPSELQTGEGRRAAVSSRLALALDLRSPPAALVQ